MDSPTTNATHHLNPADYQVFPGRAVFDEHDEHGPDDRPVRRFRREHLESIARKCNKRDRVGALCPLTLGHTRDNAPEDEQPEIVGAARNFRVTYSADMGRHLLLADFWIRRDKLDKAQSFPRVSVELWPKDGILDPIALLRRTPQRDLPQWTYARRQPTLYLPAAGSWCYARRGQRIRYAMVEQYASAKDPGAVCGSLWFHGTPSQRGAFGEGTEGHTRENRPPKEWMDECQDKVSNARGDNMPFGDDDHDPTMPPRAEHPGEGMDDDADDASDRSRDTTNFDDESLDAGPMGGPDRSAGDDAADDLSDDTSGRDVHIDIDSHHGPGAQDELSDDERAMAERFMSHYERHHPPMKYLCDHHRKKYGAYTFGPTKSKGPMKNAAFPSPMNAAPPQFPPPPAPGGVPPMPPTPPETTRRMQRGQAETDVQRMRRESGDIRASQYERRLQALEKENSLLRYERQTAAREKDAVQLEAEGYAFDRVEHMAYVKDLSPEQYSRYLQQFKRTCKKAPVGNFVRTYEGPTEGQAASGGAGELTDEQQERAWQYMKSEAARNHFVEWEEAEQYARGGGQPPPQANGKARR